MTEYFKRIGWKRIAAMLIGNFIIGMGLAVFKLSGLGNDPNTGMNLAWAARLGISFPIFQIIVNVIILFFEFVFGRHYIGIGTIVNALLLGYVISYFYSLYESIYVPTTFLQRVIVLFVGMLITTLGVSLYQTSDVGIAPFDSVSLILHDKFPKIPYFAARVLFDAACALMCFLGGGIIGLGTLATAFGLGPFIQFYNHYVSEKLLANELHKENHSFVEEEN